MTHTRADGRWLYRLSEFHALHDACLDCSHCATPAFNGITQHGLYFAGGMCILLYCDTKLLFQAIWYTICSCALHALASRKSRPSLVIPINRHCSLSTTPSRHYCNRGLASASSICRVAPRSQQQGNMIMAAPGLHEELDLDFRVERLVRPPVRRGIEFQAPGRGLSLGR